MNRFPLAVACLFAVASSLIPAVANATAYQLTYISALSQYNSGLTDINNNGQIVGFTDTGSYTYRSFVWKNGQLEDIGTLGGSKTRANAINDAGQATGWSTTAGSSYERAMIWQSGNMSSIGNLGGPNSFGADINKYGMVAGYSQYTSSAEGHPYTYSAGVTGDANMPGNATGINDLGEVAFTSSEHGYIWRNGTKTDLGGLGGGETYTTRINNSSQVVGYSYTSDGVYRHAFIWQNGRMTDLGPTGGHNYSWASDINSYGLVVGNYGWYERACMWRNGVLTDLNTLLPAGSGWTLLSADAVNDQGQIVGIGIYNGQYSGFLLAPVPEPSSALGLLSGLVAICGCSLRRRRR